MKKKISAIIISALAAVMTIPAMTGCTDNGERSISYTAPTDLPNHVLQLTLNSNYAMDDNENIIKYSYTTAYPQNVFMSMVCERGYMPDVQFSMKKDDGTVISTITDENILKYDFVRGEGNNVDREKVFYVFEPFMEESPDCDVVVSVDKLEAKTAEHTISIESINWMGNPRDYLNDAGIGISFSGDIPKKSDGTPAMDPSTRYNVDQFDALFFGDKWYAHYGDELIVTIHFPEKEVAPPTSADEDFYPLFYVYELFEGDRSVYPPVDVLITRSTTTTLTTVIPIKWDYSLDVIVEPFYQICPMPQN